MIYIYLALVLSVSAIGAYTDICTGRVKNQHLIITLAIWVGLAAGESIVTHSLANLSPAFAINLVLSFVAMLIFYVTDIWAPGDCKLYFIISIIFPMRAYVNREGTIFPALDFIIYSFAFGYIALVCSIIFRQIKGDYKTIHQKEKVPIKPSLIPSVLSSIGIIATANTAFEIYAPGFYYANQILITLCVVGLICLLQQKVNTLKNTAGFICLGYFLVQTVAISTWLSFCLSLVEGLTIAAIIEFINNKAKKNTYQEISGEEIRAGMILSLSSILAMQNCIDPNLPRTTTENRRTRINQLQAEAVKEWCKNAKSKVVIVEMIPFAPFIAMSVLMQIVRFLILTR